MDKINCKFSNYKNSLFKYAYSALPLLHFLLRFRNHHCIELHMRKLLKIGQRLAAHRYSLGRGYFSKYRCLNLHIQLFCCCISGWAVRNHHSIEQHIRKVVGLEIITASSCMHMRKLLKNGQRLIVHRYVFEELVWQNTDVWICIFCTSAAVFLV